MQPPKTELRSPTKITLGGAVVSAVGAVFPVVSVVNMDQALQLGAFKDALMPIEPMLRDDASFAAVIEGLFAEVSAARCFHQPRPTGFRQLVEPSKRSFSVCGN